MKLTLYIGGEVVGEMVFPNVINRREWSKNAVKRREERLKQNIETFKKEHLIGHRSKLPYEIYLTEQSRIHQKRFQEKPQKKVKDYRPEGRSTYSHKTSLKSS